MKKFILVSLIITSILLSSCNQNLQEFEEHALTHAQSLKDILNDPKSFQLNRDIMVIRYVTSTKNEYYYTFIDYGATNAYGGITRNAVAFVNNIFLCSFDSFGNADNITSSEFESKYSVVLMAEKFYKFFIGELERENTEFQIFDKKNFIKKLK